MQKNQLYYHRIKFTFSPVANSIRHSSTVTPVKLVSFARGNWKQTDKHIMMLST